MMSHPARARREQRQVGAALVLQLELRTFEAFADLVIGDVDDALDVLVHGIGFQIRFLLIAVFTQFFRRGGVVAVTVNDHVWCLSLVLYRSSAEST